MFPEEEMKMLEALWEKAQDLTEEEERLLEQLEIEYDAEYGYFDDDD